MAKFKRGAICNVCLDPTLGHEQQGYRPVLVLTPEAFNTLTGAAIVAPITNGGEFARRNGFSVNLSGAGVSTTGVVRCDQIRVLDLIARQAKIIEQAPEYVIDEALDIITSLFQE